MSGPRKVLVIARYFQEEYMGAIRMRRLARALPTRGYLPTILSRRSGQSQAASQGEAFRLVQVDAPDLAKLYAGLTGKSSASEAPALGSSRKIGLSSRLNRWLMIPDKDITWLRPLLAAARKLLAHEQFDLIFASLDPRTNLLAASRLAKEFHLPVVMEYRDLWTGSPYFHLDQPTRLHRYLHTRLERGVLKTANRITCLSRGIADYLKKSYPDETSDRVDVNYNFFDPAEYPAAPPSPRPTTGTRPFVISYVGAMYLSRNPFVFFDGLKLFIERHRLTPAQLQFRWLGNLVGIEGVKQHLSRHGLLPFVEYLGQVPHETALRQLLASDVTLVVQAPQDLIHIPGKIFEAMGARVPILAITPPCELSEIIARTNAGLSCPHDATAICDALHKFRAGQANAARWPFNENAVAEYSMDRAGDNMAQLFDRTILDHRRT